MGLGSYQGPGSNPLVYGMVVVIFAVFNWAFETVRKRWVQRNTPTPRQ